MSSLDSEAFFQGRCLAAGLSAQTIQAMTAKGWVTVATFAFGTSYSPGQADDRLFISQILEPLFGNPPNSIEIPKVRRLFYECHTVSVADLRNKIERSGDDSKVASMAQEERKVRLDRLRLRLQGLDIAGPLEPSHKLCDKYYGMLESGQLVWLPWEELTSREQEVLGVTKADLDNSKISEIRTDAAGFLKASKSAVELRADTNSDLQILCALQRRALAMELVGLATYESAHGLTQKYFRALQTEPLPGFNKVTVQQLIQADKYAFVKMSEVTQGSLQRDAAGNLPMVDALVKVVTEHDFCYMLMQLPGKSAAPSSEQRQRSRSRGKKGKGESGKGKGSGKSGKASKPDEGRVSTGPKNGEGKNICFAFQRKKGCPSGGAGVECSRGLHICWVKKCWGDHAGCDHKN